MKRIFAVALAAGVALAGVAAISPADADGGCGRGFHPTRHGRCVPWAGRAVLAVPVIDVFYPGRGYWDGHRYWHHRDRWHGGWRYR
jgi:hypothetical protein